jgi:exonuclease SbcD
MLLKRRKEKYNMRLLHTSDWHLGQNFFGFSRQYEHQQFLDWLLITLQATIY